jgi:hypothetical protein
MQFGVDNMLIAKKKYKKTLDDLQCFKKVLDSNIEAHLQRCLAISS